MTHVTERCRLPIWPGAPWNRHRVYRCDCGRTWHVEWIAAWSDGMWIWAVDRARESFEEKPE